MSPSRPSPHPPRRQSSRSAAGAGRCRSPRVGTGTETRTGGPPPAFPRRQGALRGRRAPARPRDCGTAWPRERRRGGRSRRRGGCVCARARGAVRSDVVGAGLAARHLGPCVESGCVRRGVAAPGAAAASPSPGASGEAGAPARRPARQVSGGGGAAASRSFPPPACGADRRREERVSGLRRMAPGGGGFRPA